MKIDWEDLLLKCMVAIGATIAAFLLLAFVGMMIIETKGEAPDGTSEKSYLLHAHVKTVRGHDYLVFIHGNGISALHAESCPCHTQK